MDEVLKESENWLKAFLLKTSIFQKKIFLEWVRSNSKKSAKEPDQPLDLLKKAFTFFFPYYFTMRSPFEIPDIQGAVEILKYTAQSSEKKILFYGDRDADGICSLSIFFLFFRDQLNYPEEKLIALLPQENDKYGITLEVAKRIISYEPDILITLDCGSSNKKEIQTIQDKLNVKVIVIDHHFIPDREADYPKVEAFINPKRLKSPDPNRDLCTSGISFKLIWALTYSFTKEYKTAYRYTRYNTGESTYLKNLIKVSEKDYLESDVRKEIVNMNSVPKEAKNSDGSNSLIDLRYIWNTTSRYDLSFNRVDHFLRLYPASIVNEDKIRFLFQSNLKKIKEKTRPFLILSAIGTIADMVPLVNDNRVLVSEGLEFINQNLRSQMRSSFLEGILALLRTMFSQQQKVTEEDLAYNVCPVINAAGRLGNAPLALDTLLEKDRLSAIKMAFDLKNLNENRKKISHKAFSSIRHKLASQEDKPVIIIYDPRVHRGISGLLANRLSNQYKKPALVMVDDGDSIRGSIRAYKNENVLLFIKELESFFIQYGGHKQAAGFSIEYSLKDDFIQEAEKVSADLFKPQKSVSGENIHSSLSEPLDELQENSFKAIELYDHEIQTSLWEECRIFAPFGKENPHPVLAIRITQPVEKIAFGKTNDHLKIKMKALKSDQVEGIWFFHNGEADQLTEEYHSYKILAEPQINDYNGRKNYRLNIKSIVTAVSE